jgi:hypothetical protein
MGIAVAEAVMKELRIFDKHAAVAAEDSVFAIVEIAVADGNILAFLPDARAVIVCDFRIGKFDVFHNGVVSAYDKDCFPVGNNCGRFEVRELRNSPDYRVAGAPDACLVYIGAGIDFNGIAGKRRACGVAWRFIGAGWADKKFSGVR